MIALRLHARPLAWLAALAAAAWPFGGAGTAAWLGIAALAGGAPVDAASLRAAFFEMLFFDPATVLGRAAAALVGWVALAVLSLDVVDGKGAGPEGPMRLLRTRAIGAVATAAVLAIPVYGCALAIDQDALAALGALGAVALGVVLATATAWLALSDRFALRRFDVASDRRAQADADAKWNAPYYLNTGSPGKSRHSVSSGADQAVTDGGASLLGARGVALVLGWLALDTLRAAIAASFGPWVGAAAAVEIALLAAGVCTSVFVRR
ncbi:MAG: hypothetical protein U0234_28485 [Sandaracinus sp.]